VSEIQKCVARHRFLWADQIYQSAVAATDEECDALLGMHEDEIREIEDKLVKLTTCDKGEVAMLKNVSEGLSLARTKEVVAARDALERPA
jgi:hypothetical protein